MSERHRTYKQVLPCAKPSNKPNVLDGCEPVYILSAVSIHSRTKEDLKTEFEIFKLKYPVWKTTKTLKDFLKFKADFHQTKYNIDTYDTAYFLDSLTGIHYAKQNMADIYEAGSYPFLVLYSRPTEHMYAEANPCQLWLFKFDTNTRMYKEITRLEDDERYLYIAAQFDTFQKLPAETIDHLLN